MKGKLPVIGILALLVIVMMPMASAAPADQRIRQSVYLLSGCDSPSDFYAECTVVSTAVGTYAASSLYSSDTCGTENTFKQIVAVSRLPPSTMYQVVLFDSPGGGINARFDGSSHLLLGIATDENGRVRVTEPTCDSSQRETIKTSLANRYYVGLIKATGDI